MGYEHYLRRNDNRTLFLLGKHVWDWEPILRRGFFRPEDTTDLAVQLAARMREDEWDRPGNDGDVLDIDAYAILVAERIVAWCDGHVFEFVGEDGFEEWEFDSTWDYDTAVTGTRYVEPGARS
jgi:hypothetical protein